MLPFLWISKVRLGSKEVACLENPPYFSGFTCGIGVTKATYIILCVHNQSDDLWYMLHLHPSPSSPYEPSSVVVLGDSLLRAVDVSYIETVKWNQGSIAKLVVWCMVVVLG